MSETKDMSGLRWMNDVMPVSMGINWAASDTSDSTVIVQINKDGTITPMSIKEWAIQEIKEMPFF